MIRYLLSKLLLIEAVLLLVPVSVAIYYQESSQVFIALFSTIGILVLLGGLGVLRKPKNQRIYAKEGVLIVALCWILWSFFGGLFSNEEPGAVDTDEWALGEGFISVQPVQTDLTDYNLLKTLIF